MEKNIYCKIRITLFYIGICYVLNVNTIGLGPSTQSEAYFNGSSYVRLQTTISLKNPTGLSFRTCTGGILFSQQQNDDLIELSVNTEGMIFQAKTAGKHFEEKINGVFINNKWHTVFLQYILGNLTLQVDGIKHLLANSSYQTELLTSPGLYNEGATVLLIGKQFNGCLLEGPSLVFDTSIITSSHNVVFEPCPIPYDSCIPRENNFLKNHCSTSPCLIGTCINGPKDYSCSCPPRYTGKNCESDVGDPCDKVPPVCQNSGTCTSDTSGRFTCSCVPGTTGRYCESEISTHVMCKNKPCLHGGNCEVNTTAGVAECRCLPGYGGNNCEINLDECLSNPCQNSGICLDGLNNFSCNCTNTGYMGKYCDIDINECVQNPCLNNGNCFNTYGSYMCQCPSGYKGPNCEIEINECESQPCHNNGECIEAKGGYKCKCLHGFFGDLCEYQLESRIPFSSSSCDMNPCSPQADCLERGNSYVCMCKPEYPGDYPNCNADSICAPNPCKNGEVCSAYMGTYNCSCPSGYAGPACQWVSCYPDFCLNGGTCLKNICICPEGWTGVKCQKHIHCRNNPCKNAKSCQDYLGGYYCTCEPGWTGLNCNLKLVLCPTNNCLVDGNCYRFSDECHCASGFTGPLCKLKRDECATMPCLNGGTCMDMVNGFRCNCTENWMGTLCEKPYEACEFRPCKNNGTCIRTGNPREISCKCPIGFQGDLCEINIDDCVNVKCPAGRVCRDLVNDFECVCPEGYGGDNCKTDQNPCAKDPCGVNEVCTVDNATFTFVCSCLPGFDESNCTLDINECNFSPKLCNQGICINSHGSFQCYCKPGFTGDFCDKDFDECLSQPCKNNATCHNKINNFVCDCPPGYAGKDCSFNIDECKDMPCRNGGTCIDGINEFTCNCPPGFTGKACEVDIDDCEPNPCLHGSKCIDDVNSYSCNCTDTGYEGSHCEINIDDCLDNICLNEAQCIDKVKDYECKCYPGYAGKNCETDIDECEKNPCRYDGTCLEKSNQSLYMSNYVNDQGLPLPQQFNKSFDITDASGYVCLCKIGVEGVDCEHNIDECIGNPCRYGVCHDQIGGFNCVCDEGYEGLLCDKDIDECALYNPCMHGVCKDRRANYECLCEQNFGGKNCSVELTGCIQNPCTNNGVCKPYLYNEVEHKFNCSCPNGFYGTRCEEQTTMSFSVNSSVQIMTSRDEGYDIQFRFKTTLGDGLLALGKGSTYYILELLKGRLNLHSSLLNKWEGVFIGSNLNNSEWQRVFVAINSTHLVLSANDEQTIYPISFNENYNASSTSFPLTYIGGIPSNLRKLIHGQPFLVGCTEDVLINGEWVLPQSRNISGLTFHNVDVGCSRRPQCSPNPCQGGGHCTDKWRDFSCMCERPYLGHTCQYNYTAATFGFENITDSMVTVSVNERARRAVRSIVDISMFIRTRQSKGHIFYLGSLHGTSNVEESYIAAQLEGGELLVSIYFNGSQESYTVGGVKLDNGYNHLIEVIRNVTLVQVKLNGTEYFRKTISATGTLDAQVLYLGGQPQLRPVRQAENIVTTKIDLSPSAPAAVTASLSKINFKGIIQDVQVSNGSTIMIVEFYPLKAEELIIPIPFGEVTFDNTTVLKGIHSDDSCKINPCQRARCENTWNDYRCHCPRGYKGKDCKEKEFCELDKCPQNSICKNLEDGRECITNSTFNGHTPPLQYGLEVLPNSTKQINFDTIELTYRTRSWGVVLFAKHKYNENFFVIFIYHNEVIVEWSLNQVLNTIRFKKDRFLGQWLTLYFTYKDSVFKGGFKDSVMDESPNFEVGDFDIVSFGELFKNGTIYIAGSDNKTFDYQNAINNSDFNTTGYIPESDTTTVSPLVTNSLEIIGESSTEDVLLYKVDLDKKTDRFKGCLGEIRIGGLLLPFFTSKELYSKNHISEEYFELKPGSQADVGCTLCYNEDCFNQGFCIDPLETYKCNCTEGYTADDCSIDIDECKNNQCQNNATCVDLIARYKCDCPPGFEGDHCEHEIDECLSNPCRHGATCENLIGNFKCICPEGFIGIQCEAPLLVTCDNKPCFEGATCETGPNNSTGHNYTCFCTEGMQGNLCDVPFCKVKPCMFGSCNTTGLVPYCECTLGYDGVYCENNINDCLLSNGASPCENDGVCIDGIAGYECNCTETGFRGLNCENDIDECMEMISPCGRGRCENMNGTYRCTCDEQGKCGHQCNLDDPCKINPCEHGECISHCNLKADYICKCEENYMGKNCTQLKVVMVEAASDLTHGVNILYIVIPVLLILLVGFAIVMAVLVNIARSKRATRGTYSPSAQEFCNPRVELDHVLKPPPEERLI